MLVFWFIVFSCFEDLNEPVPAPVANDYQSHQDLEKIVKENRIVLSGLVQNKKIITIFCKFCQYISISF